MNIERIEFFQRRSHLADQCCRNRSFDKSSIIPLTIGGHGLGYVTINIKDNNTMSFFAEDAEPYNVDSLQIAEAAALTLKRVDN